jgi:hypothetical protein
MSTGHFTQTDLHAAAALSLSSAPRRLASQAQPCRAAQVDQLSVAEVWRAPLADSGRRGLCGLRYAYGGDTQCWPGRRAFRSAERGRSVFERGASGLGQWRRNGRAGACTFASLGGLGLDRERRMGGVRRSGGTRRCRRLILPGVSRIGASPEHQYAHAESTGNCRRSFGPQLAGFARSQERRESRPWSRVRQQAGVRRQSHALHLGTPPTARSATRLRALR